MDSFSGGCIIKVKLFLYLSKYHALKIYPVLNEAPLYEDGRERSGVEWRYSFTHS
jgi:hypothetical protein